MTVGEKIRELREKEGISLRTLAHILGKDPAQISRWENGIQTPSIYSLRAVAFALKADINDFIELL